MNKWKSALADAAAETWSLRWVILALAIGTSLVVAIFG